MPYASLYGSNVGTVQSDGFAFVRKSIGVTTDASKSGIVGTVTRIQISCKYIIKH